MRTSVTFPLSDPADFKKRLLRWVQGQGVFLWLDSNTIWKRPPQKHQSYEALLAVDCHTVLQTDGVGAFAKFDRFHTGANDWLFGYFGYDLKNDIEDLSSNNYDGLGFPDLFFFQPKKLFLLQADQVELAYHKDCAGELQHDWETIERMLGETVEVSERELGGTAVKARISKAEYLEKVQQMQAHIQRGDIYEANFCQEYYAEGIQIDPLLAYEKLNTVSEPPFAAFLRLEDRYLLSATPERYLRRVGERVVSQPIKGTARRSTDSETDRQLARALLTDEKERAENIMITDLVRNDLSRTAAANSVAVEELCGLYTFKQVHQLISTVVSRAKPGTSVTDLIRTTFPMGSMTGAPKISAMKIIEALETTKRGLYSGAVGYVKPNGDFDFNVVIRSILYNHTNRYASFSVGSAITAKSKPESEYEECLVKAEAMRSVLET